MLNKFLIFWYQITIESSYVLLKLKDLIKAKIHTKSEVNFINK